MAEVRDSIEMVLIPAGPFKMGDNSLGGLPERQVDLPAFEIGRYEVTNAEYEPFVIATNAIAPLNWEQGRPPKECFTWGWFDALSQESKAGSTGF